MSIKIFTLLWLFISMPLTAGFPAGTLITTLDGYIKIEDLSVNCSIQSYDFTITKKSSIIATQSYNTPTATHVILDTDTSIIASDDQQWYVANQQSWKKSKDLKAGDKLLTIKNEQIGVKELAHIQEPIDLFDISLQEPHTYYVTKHCILVHNAAFFTPAASLVGTSALWATGIPQIAAVVSALGIAKYLFKSLKSKPVLRPQNNTRGTVQTDYQPHYPSMPPSDPHDDKKREPNKKRQLPTKNAELPGPENLATLTPDQLATKIKKLNPSVGNLSKLEQAVKILKDIPGAMENIIKLLRNGIITETLGTARGAAYELEKAYDFIKNGIEVLGFNIKYQSGSVIREFDIILKDKLIECKSIDWNRLLENSKQMNKFKSNICDQVLIAKNLNKRFELYSKQPIPTTLKEWFSKKGVLFYEG